MFGTQQFFGGQQARPQQYVSYAGQQYAPTQIGDIFTQMMPMIMMIVMLAMIMPMMRGITAPAK